jgi:carboxyl-terminal processing protease
MIAFKFGKNKVINITAFIVFLCLMFGAGFFVGQKSVVRNICTPANVDFSLFWDAYNKLHENFIDSSKITDQNIIYGAIEGMTKSLGDPFTDFFNPTQAKMFEQDLAGSFEGIGVQVGIKNDQLTIIAPLKGTPGDRAGLKAGDLIIKIDGKSTSDMSSDDAVNLIRGKKGTSVTLSIYREDWKDTKDFVIVRDTIKVDSVTWELKNGDVAYIHMNQFDQTLSPDFSKIANEIIKSPAKKIVLDLRNNPGGYLEVCQEIAGWFLKSGQLVTIEDFGKGKDQKQYKAQGNAEFSNYPIVILMNKGSASAAEILAGALRDDRGVQLIGEKSFGKGSVQQVVDLMDGKSFLKITIAKWLTPKGNSISEVGLTPDIKVDISEADANAGKDTQLEKALEIIQNLR